jgi:PHS family inorganic phosphate transporter-like MFS transporter
MDENGEFVYESFEENRALISTPSPPMTSDDANDATTKTPWYQNSTQITAMISNFSTSYNVVNISLVLPILKELHSGSTDEDTAVVASSLLAGMIFGQLVGGALGDSWLGRMGALRLVMALQIVASVACACAGAGKNASAESIFLHLAAWRFVLGIGCGGVYPLAAVISAEEGDREREQVDQGQLEEPDQDEQESTMDNASSVQRVVLTFSMQGIGFVCVPLVAVFLFSFSSNLDFVWRTMLGIGALPGVILMCLQCIHSRRDQHQSLPSEEPLGDVDQTDDVATATDTTEDIDDEPGTTLDETITDTLNDSSSHGGEWLKSLFHEPGLGRKVLGTAGTWFLFDVVFYGNTIFQPIVVAAAFGTQSGNDGIDLLRKTAMDSLILTSIALPGYAVAGIVLGKKTLCVTQTPRYVMLQGFAGMAILYAAIGFNWSYLRGDPTMLVFLYGMTFFFANYGPNTTTFILPSLIFEEDHRATWNGVSAAAGKLGALTGATLFEPAADILGDHVVMLICAGVALLAYILTFCAIPKQQTLEDSATPVSTTDDEISSTPSTGEVV